MNVYCNLKLFKDIICIKINKHQSSTKILIICHYFICCKLTFNLHKNIKLHILNINYHKFKFQIFLEIYFEIKILIFISIENKFIHNYSFTQIEFTCSLMFNEILL
jgi:hypothetical protein